jgi:hypothetical protein
VRITQDSNYRTLLNNVVDGKFLAFGSFYPSIRHLLAVRHRGSPATVPTAEPLDGLTHRTAAASTFHLTYLTPFPGSLHMISSAVRSTE